MPIASEAINRALAEERGRIHRGEHRFRRGATLLFRESADGVTTDSKAVVREAVGGFQFDFVAGEFFQTNPHILPRMVDYVIREARGPGDCTRLVDAYCGVGVFAICASPHFEEIAGVEVNSRAFALAEKNLALNDTRNVRFVEGDAEAIFARIAFSGENAAVILDPPRKGCSPAFLAQLAGFRPRRVVYVSCGPDTQARDLRLLAGAGFRVTRVQPFDLFPHTRHIENVATLEGPRTTP